MKKYIYLCIGIILLHIAPIHAQIAPADSIALENDFKSFRQETIYEKKLAIYQKIISNPEFEKMGYNDVKLAGMQRDFAVNFAKKGMKPEYYSWSHRIQAPVMRGIAIEQGFQEFFKIFTPAVFEAEIRIPLDSLVKIQPWDNHAGSLYSSLIKLYIAASTNESDQKAIVNYLTPLYTLQGNFFSADLMSANRTNDIAQSQAYHYAKAYANIGDQKRAFEVLAKAVEIGTFSTEELLAKKQDFADIKNLDTRLKTHLEKSKAEYVAKVKSLLAKSTLTGQPAKLDAKNKYIVLDFWGSWCVPCRYSHPKMIELYAKYKDRGLEFISVSHEMPTDMAKMRERWEAAVKVDKMTWPQLLNNQDIDKFNAVQQFAIAMFPTKIVLDKDFNKVAEFKGGNSSETLAIKLKELLGE